VDRFFSLGLETFWNLIEIYNNKASSNFEGRIQSAQFENEMQEISYLIATMNEKHEHGIKWNEMAILVRHLSLSSDLLNAISRSGIPIRQPSRGSTFSWDDIDGFNNPWRQPIDPNEDDSIDAVTVVPARYSNGRSWPVLYIPQCDVHHWPIPLPDQIQMNDNQRAFFLEEEHKLFLRSTIRAEKQIVFTWSQYEKGDIQ
jgi:superfamily I DNA/RNA helicase